MTVGATRARRPTPVTRKSSRSGWKSSAVARATSQRPPVNRHRRPNHQQRLPHDKPRREPERAPPRSPERLVEPPHETLGAALVAAPQTSSPLNIKRRRHRQTRCPQNRRTKRSPHVRTSSMNAGCQETRTLTGRRPSANSPQRRTRRVAPASLFPAARFAIAAGERVRRHLDKYLWAAGSLTARSNRSLSGRAGSSGVRYILVPPLSLLHGWWCECG